MSLLVRRFFWIIFVTYRYQTVFMFCERLTLARGWGPGLQLVVVLAPGMSLGSLRDQSPGPTWLHLSAVTIATSHQHNSVRAEGSDPLLAQLWRKLSILHPDSKLQQKWWQVIDKWMVSVSLDLNLWWSEFQILWKWKIFKEELRLISWKRAS